MSTFVTRWILDFKEDVSRPVKQIGKGAKGASAATLELNDNLKKTIDPLQEIKKAAAVAFAAFGFNEIKNITVEIGELENRVKRLAGVTDDEASRITDSVVRISDIYKQDYNEVLLAANALTKQMGGTFQSNLKLIEQGFKSGADFSGDFINQLKEYPAQFVKAGLSASEMIAIMSQGVTEGVFSDKAPDTIKEMTLALTEMTQTQVDALSRIGVDAQDVMDDINSGARSPFQAMQDIIVKMKDMDVAARQTVIADVFKGAGEDLGDAFLNSLAEIDTNLNNLESENTDFVNVLQDMREMWADIKNVIADAVMPVFTTIFKFVKENKEVFIVLTAILGGLAIGLGIATVAQWNLNVAMLANPIGLIVAGIAGLAAILVVAYNKFEPVRQVIDSIGLLFKELWNQIKALFSVFGEIFSALGLFNEEGGSSIDWGKIMAFVVQAMTLNLRIFIAILGGVVKALRKSMEHVRDWVKNNREQIAGFVERVKGFFIDLWNRVKSIFIAIGEFIWNYHPAALLVRGIDALFPGLKEKLLEVWNWIYENFIQPIKEAFSGIGSFFGFGGDTVEVEHTNKDKGNGQPGTDNGNNNGNGGGLFGGLFGNGNNVPGTTGGNGNTGLVGGGSSGSGGGGSKSITMNINVTMNNRIDGSGRDLNNISEDLVRLLTGAARDASIVLGS